MSRFEKVGYNPLTTPHKQQALDDIAGFLLGTSAHIARKKGLTCYVGDMTAGPGIYDNGEEGSPLILARHVSWLIQHGYHVEFLCVEEHPGRLDNLRTVMRERYPDLRPVFSHSQLEVANAIPVSAFGLTYWDPTGYTRLDAQLLCGFGINHPYMDILITRQGQGLKRLRGWSRTAPNALETMDYLELARKQCRYIWPYARHDDWHFAFGDNWPKRPQDKMGGLVRIDTQSQQGELPWE